MIKITYDIDSRDIYIFDFSKQAYHNLHNNISGTLDMISSFLNSNLTDLNENYFDMCPDEILLYQGESFKDFKEKFPEYIL